MERTTLEWAQDYLAHSWMPLPVPRGTKIPIMEEWQNFETTAEELPQHFGNGTNIGILTGEASGGLTDVDLDCDEAVNLARAFLRKTPMKSGHRKRPESHHWYRMTGSLPYMKFVAPPENGEKVGATLLELRTGGHQTVVAPSIHPDGDPYEWNGPLEPLEIDPDELLADVRALAAATLVARSWPGPLSRIRHDVANALAGMLLRSGWDVDRAASFIEACARAAGDDEAHLRGKDVGATAEAMRNGKPTTGAPSLGKMLGNKVVAKVREWLGAGGDEAAAVPVIRFATKAEPVVDRAQDAILALEDCPIYQRGGILARISRDGSPPVKNVRRDPRSPVIAPLPEVSLWELMGSVATWERYNIKQDEWTAALPPTWASRALLARASWPFPELIGVASSPIMRPDGSICRTPGFDPATGIYLEPEVLGFPPIPERPTHEQAMAALDVLKDPYTDVPYATASDRSAAIAYSLTLVGRSAIPGGTPLFAVTATAPGTGKGLQTECSVYIATGRTAAITTAAPDNEEWRKLITSFAIDGSPAIIIDNISGAFGCNVLAGALTCHVWQDRILGSNKKYEGPLRAVWAVTGNGVTFKGDLARRVVRIHLDARRENPEDRTGFKYPDLRARVAQERPNLLTAALTILSAYSAAGRPSHDLTPMGSYEPWDSLIRGALIWLDEADPLETRSIIREQADQDLTTLREIHRAWTAAFQQEYVTASDVVERARKIPTLEAEATINRDLGSALAEWLGRPLEKLDARILGQYLNRYDNRIVGELEFQRGKPDTHGKRNTWRVGLKDERE